MDQHTTALPGAHKDDPPGNIDPVASHVERIKTNLVWIDQYRLNIEHLLQTDQGGVEKELMYLKHATDTAIKHLRRLTDLLLAGHKVNVDKKIPPNVYLPPERRDL